MRGVESEIEGVWDEEFWLAKIEEANETVSATSFPFASKAIGCTAVLLIRKYMCVSESTGKCATRRMLLPEADSEVGSCGNTYIHVTYINHHPVSSFFTSVRCRLLCTYDFANFRSNISSGHTHQHLRLKPLP